MCFKDSNNSRVVIFLGPDGAGKSTLITHVAESLKSSNCNCRTFYFAPGYLKRYRPKSKNTITIDPHNGLQYSSYLVFIKIMLMLLEFNLGIRRAKLSNDILIFDRFIHDILVDPIRYRMGRTRWWMRLLLKMAPKPDLVVIVVAPAEIIHSRKQEVPFEETIRQLEDYRLMTNSFDNSLIIENTSSPEVGAEIILSRIRSL